MRKIKFCLGAGFSRHDETFEFEDDTSDEEIDAACDDWVRNCMNCSWIEIIEITGEED